VTGQIEEVRVRPWSAVLRVPTREEALYFKEQVPLHAHEVRLIEILAARRPDLLPEVVAAEGGRMLMRDAGPQLSSILEQDRDLRYWEEALPPYAELQIEAAPDADALVAAGAFDRRAAVLPAIYDELIEEPPEGQTEEECAALRQLAPEARRVCAELAAAPVPETIQNDDFTDGSIHVVGRTYRFLDWGDACVSHPFFTLTVTQRVIEIRHGLPVDSPEIARVRDAYLEPFTRFAPRAELDPLVEPARKFGQICRAALELELERAEGHWDEPDELAWSLRLLLDPEAWRSWQD
jgi:hypothetical protein